MISFTDISSTGISPTFAPPNWRRPSLAASLTVTYLFVAFVCSISVVAQENNSESAKGTTTTNAGSSTPKTKANEKKRSPGITPEREAAVRTFVEQHHPELRELLINLKQNESKQYEAAIRDLFRTTERLAQIQEKDGDRYEHELKVWKLQSRIQLLTARLKMIQTPELKQQIEQALNEQIELQIQSLKDEKSRLADRSKKLDEQLARIEKNRRQIVSKQVSAIEADIKPKQTAKQKQKADRERAAAESTKLPKSSGELTPKTEQKPK